MADDEAGRWDVGAKSGAVYLERFSGDDDRTFGDVLTPEDARQLAGLLTKFADKAEEAESEDPKDSDSDDAEDSDADSDDADDSDDDEESDKSD
jgi:hypothetical protein